VSEDDGQSEDRASREEEGSSVDRGSAHSGADHTEWPPSQALLTQLTGLGRRVRESPLSEAWAAVSERAAARLFEWWVDSGSESGGDARELFNSRQVRTTGKPESSAASGDPGEAADSDDSEATEKSTWVQFVGSAGALLDASRRAGAELSRRVDGSDGRRPETDDSGDGFDQLSDEARESVSRRWKELRERYPDWTDALLEAIIEQSGRQEGFESPGRTVVTASDDTSPAGEGGRGEGPWWVFLVGEASDLEELADRAVALAFREVFSEPDDSFGSEDSGATGPSSIKGSPSPDEASGFMRALERIMMEVVDAAMFDDHAETASDREEDRDDPATES